MLFFGMCLRESARTASKSRTNISTNSGKATKRLGRLAPNLAHVCKFIWEWICAKQIAPRDTRHETLGGGGFRGSTIQKSGEAVRLAPTLVQYPRWNWGGGVRVSQIQKYGEALKRLDRLAPHLAHICSSIWEWISSSLGRRCVTWLGEGLSMSSPNDPVLCCPLPWIYAKQIAPRDTRGALGGFRGQTLKSLGKLSNGWTDWHQLWFTSGNGHRLNPSRPSIPQGAFWGGG